MKKSLLSFLLSCLSIALLAQNKQATYCNPIDIGYRYNFEQMNEGISYRSGADPVIVTHKKKRILFVRNYFWRLVAFQRFSQLELCCSRQMAYGRYVRTSSSFGARYLVFVPVDFSTTPYFLFDRARNRKTQIPQSLVASTTQRYWSLGSSSFS